MSSEALGPTTGRRESYAGAVQVCEECLEAALADNSLVGLWGGTDEKERREVRRGERWRRVG